MAAHRLGHQQSLESHPYGPMVRIPRLFVDTFWHGFWGLEYERWKGYYGRDYNRSMLIHVNPTNLRGFVGYGCN